MLDYDNGRKFGCFGIVGSVINYATEAKKVDQLAECSFLKALITGDTVEVERKNQQGEYYKPQCIALFSTNEDVNFRNNSEAVKSRYAQIPFTKTFARHPKPGELRADSRFHDDPSFVKENICPAFINLLIEELQNLLDKGIDYTATDADMESDKYNNDRIYCYFTNKGIVHVPGGKASGHYVLLKDAWDVYLEGLEKDGVDEELRRKNNKDYCNDMRRFSSWVKRSYLGIESDQVNLKGQYPTVLWGLAWERDLSTHAHNQGTVSLPEYTPQTHQGTQPHTPNKSECESVCEGVNSVCDSEALSREECVHVCEGKWIALHPDSEHGSDNKASWKLCKVIRPGNNFKTWFWVIFDGETQERKIAASDIEPDPTGEDW
jgi:phage/plasmid-associated DNA primase